MGRTRAHRKEHPLPGRGKGAPAHEVRTAHDARADGPAHRGEHRSDADGARARGHIAPARRPADRRAVPDRHHHAAAANSHGVLPPRRNGADWFATRAPGDYLYIEYYAEDGETIELRDYYDLEADPYELTNLYGPDGQPGTGDDLGTPQYTVAELHDRLRRDRFCKGAACPPGPGGGTVDVKPPRTVITAPAPDSTVCCRVKLKALAHDNVGIDHVEFRVDGNLIGTDSSHPYSVLWENTGAYATGSHMVEAIAVDSSTGANSTVAG